MSTTFSPEEIVQAGQLRNISQRELQEEIKKHEKLGLYFNNDGLSVVLLQYDRYKALVERLEELEEILEDIQLADHYGKRTDTPREEWLQKPPDMTMHEFYNTFKRRKAKQDD